MSKVSRERIIPQAAQDRPPNIETMAREALGMPPEWSVCVWERLGNHPNYYGEKVEGGIPRLLKAGPRKGQRTWRDKLEWRMFTATDDQLDAWVLAWELETGLCSPCHGSGQKWTEWSAENGHKYKTCTKCAGTGKKK